MASGKPSIVCPHCNEWLAGPIFPGQKAYRNNFGIDVWICPKCDGKFKIETSEYIFVRDQIASGAASVATAISGYPEEEPTPSELDALVWQQRRKAKRNLVLLVLGAAFTGIVIALIWTRIS